eukprot:GSChrysophyteH1.ASY1.ANO1.1732.1 assembled CDS
MPKSSDSVLGNLSANQREEQRKQRILSIAQDTAISWGSSVFIFTGTAVAALSVFHPRFRKAQVSMKVAIPVMAGVFTFSLKYEHTQHRLKLQPDLVGDLNIPSEHDPQYLQEKSNPNTNKVQSSMPIRHKIGNYLYDHPFSMIVAFGVPFAIYIFRRQLAYKHLSTSQKVMHSRVIAQGGILSFTLSTMAFRNYMDRNGRFPDPAEITSKKRLQVQ